MGADGDYETTTHAVAPRVQHSNGAPSPTVEHPDILGQSDAIRELLWQVGMVANTDSTVLLHGETGTGKELVAKAIRDLSSRANGPFVRLNCSGVPANLLESELFGHERGAFTGASSRRVGRFELAHLGTILLDEIGELALELQPKLLRVIQEREFERIGGDTTVKSDTRIVAATHRDLGGMVAAGTFREDLYYRLNVFPIRVPPLRERREDIPLLADWFTTRYARRMGKVIRSIDPASIRELTSYDWPGNVRELQNVIERAVILSHGPVLSVSPRKAASTTSGTMPAAPSPASTTLEHVQREHILAALAATGWVVDGRNGAAARLGLKRSTLLFRMKKLGIVRPR